MEVTLEQAHKAALAVISLAPDDYPEMLDALGLVKDGEITAPSAYSGAAVANDLPRSGLSALPGRQGWQR